MSMGESEITLKELSQAVRFHRKKSGLSQAELAKHAGVGKTVVFDIEKGKQTVQLDTLLKVLGILNIRPVFQSPLMDTFLRDVTQEPHEKG
jgi:HTH-type transcriptional regulator / antitoxin HipB